MVSLSSFGGCLTISIVTDVVHTLTDLRDEVFDSQRHMWRTDSSREGVNSMRFHQRHREGCSRMDVRSNRVGQPGFVLVASIMIR